MEVIKIKPNDSKAFDELVHGGLPDDGKLVIATKEDATREGRPAVVLSFRVQVNGQIKRVQTVTTLRALKIAVNGLGAAHPGESGML